MPILNSQTFNVRRWRRTDVAWGAVWGGAMIGLEIAGRQIGSDVGDAIALLILLTLSTVTLRSILRTPNRAAWARRADRRIGDWFATEHRFGVDFRSDPPIPPGSPVGLTRAATILGITTLLLTGGARFFPEIARDQLTRVTYCGYLLLLAATWAALLLGLTAFGWLIYAAIHDRGLRRQGPSHAPSKNVRLLFGVLLVAVAATRFLPPWLPLLLILVTTISTAQLLLLPGPSPLRIVWRKGNGPMRSIDCGNFLALRFLIGLLSVINLIILTRGDRLGAAPIDTDMVITPRLGLFFAWVAAIGMGTLAWHAIRLGIHRLRFDRALHAPIAVELPMSLNHTEATLAQLRWRDRGLRLTRSATRIRNAVRLKIDPEATYPVGPFDRVTWPLHVPSIALTNSDLPDVLRRRRHRVLRRQLLGGLRRAFVGAAPFRGGSGGGVWVAPQHWFMTGLTRDESHDENSVGHRPLLDDGIGPPFHRCLTWPARAHFLTVSQGLDIDLLFVEDGVDFPRLSLVLENLFELHDIFGGRQPAEERHFAGIPGVRVILDNFQLGERPTRRDYPEPDYEEIARARILHVFLDRGGRFEASDLPTELQDLPAPFLTH